MDRKWNFLPPRREGLAARQAHVDLPEGSYEREVGRDGFYGAAAQIYHRNPPTAWASVEGPLRHRLLTPANAIQASGSPWDATLLASNANLRVRYWRCERAMDHLARNADGDELLFAHRGGGELYCDYGHLTVETGDYVVLPRGTMWRLETSAPADFLLVESTAGPYSLPDRGPLGKYMPFDPGVLDCPKIDEAFRARQGPGTWRVRVKARNQLSTITYPYHPLDAVGWQGDLHPVRLNVRDIRPASNHRMHTSPQTHTTFLGNRFVVCSLVPRPMETDPRAVKLPFFHSNDDYDELLFIHRGAHPARGKIMGEGSMSFHPMGLTHGPHPLALKHMYEFPNARTEMWMLMIDALDPLEVPPMAAGFEAEDYVHSWRDSIEAAPDAKREKVGA